MKKHAVNGQHTLEPVKRKLNKIWVCLLVAPAKMGGGGTGSLDHDCWSFLRVRLVEGMSKHPVLCPCLGFPVSCDLRGPSDRVLAKRTSFAWYFTHVVGWGGVSCGVGGVVGVNEISRHAGWGVE